MPSVDSAAHNLGYWNAAAAARYPDKIAIFDLSRDPPRMVSYAELESRLDRVASTLALGLSPGDRLAMSISNRVEFVETMFGVMRAGVVPVPLKAKGRDVGEEELKQFCLANDPAYAHPRRIDFVVELLLNRPGKIDRKVVQRMMRERYGRSADEPAPRLVAAPAPYGHATDRPCFR